MNIWHRADPTQIKPESFLACIEISQGSKNKYELDKYSGALKLDRILYTSTHYPHNYGFIPRTYADDGDPLDVLVICSEPIIPLALVECYPIGMLEMIDNGSKDAKIIAIAKNDPVYNSFSLLLWAILKVALSLVQCLCSIVITSPNTSLWLACKVAIMVIVDSGLLRI